MPKIPAQSIELSAHSDFFPGLLVVSGGWVVGVVEGNISLPVLQPALNGLVKVTPIWHVLEEFS